MNQNIKIPESKLPRIVIIGGGFGGLELVKHLRGSQYQVVLIDKHNYFTFQPLLYQVATSALEPSSIAAPFRSIFEGYDNVVFRMASVHEVVPELNKIRTSIGEINYDYLVIATGSTTNFFNMEDVKLHAQPMKSIPQALGLRSMLLQNFEKAVSLEWKSDEQESLVDMVVVGGGPTGVETAGALAELKKHVLPYDYPDLDFDIMDIYLVEMGPRLLPGMSQAASDKTREFLEKMGVHVWLNTALVSYDGYRAVFKDGRTILTTSMIYAAGVAGCLPDGLHGQSIGRGRRLLVDEHLRVKGYQNIFAVGDIAAFIPEGATTPLPMLAQVAMQGGTHVAKYLKKGLPENMPGFKYWDKGTMATIGRNKAVADLKFWKTQGVFAWFIWMFIHLMSLVGWANRVRVFMSWAYSYFSSDKRFRLIIRPFLKEEDPVKV